MKKKAKRTKCLVRSEGQSLNEVFRVLHQAARRAALVGLACSVAIESVMVSGVALFGEQLVRVR